MEKLWFRRKSYGWGWTPASKEGWITVILFIAAILYTAQYAETNLLKFFTYLVFLIALLLVITYMKGEKPKWQWGKK